MPTARDATIAIVQREIAASAIISSFALAVRGKVLAGEKAVAFVKARNAAIWQLNPEFLHTLRIWCGIWIVCGLGVEQPFPVRLSPGLALSL